MSTKQQKAQDIFDQGNVQQVNKDTFVCHGSNGNQYEIQVNKDPTYNYKYYCKCPAWKFDNTRECKHVLAVELLRKSSHRLIQGQTMSNANPRMIRAQQAQVQAKVGRKRASGGYKVRKSKEKCESELENKGKDGKNKPLKFDKNGKLIVQYTTKVTPQIEEDEF